MRFCISCHYMLNFYQQKISIFFFLREFQPMASVSDDSSFIIWEASLPNVGLNKSMRHEPKQTIPANWRPRRESLPQHQISFWCRQRLSPKSLIQLSETLPVDLIGTHQKTSIFFFLRKKKKKTSILIVTHVI